MTTAVEELELQSAKRTLYGLLQGLKREPTEVEVKVLYELTFDPHIREVLHAAFGGKNEQG